MKVKLVKEKDGWIYVYGKQNIFFDRMIKCFAPKEMSEAIEFCKIASKIEGNLTEEKRRKLRGDPLPIKEEVFNYENGEEVK